MLNAGELKKLTSQKYMRALEGEGPESKNRIAFLVGQGGITRGSPDDTGLSDDGITSEGFDKLLRQVGSDNQIKGVIVRIDSPGGEVTASDEIWREMMLLRQKKPLVISMSDTAASGGYYIAMTGDQVLAYPGTLTGSIGVVYGKPDLHGLYDKLGITKDTLTRGRFADIDSDYHPLDAGGAGQAARGDRRKLQGIREEGGGGAQAHLRRRSSRSRRAAYGSARRRSRTGWWMNWAASTGRWN